MKHQLSLSAVLAVAASFGAGWALADSVCEKGMRDTAPADRATATHVLETIRDALPAAPQGWQIVGNEASFVRFLKACAATIMWITWGRYGRRSLI